MSHTHYTLTHGKVTDGIYRKVVSGSRHMLRSPRAWAIDAHDLEAAEALGTHELEIYDEETQITYTSTLTNFKAHAFRVSRGFGPQWGLEIKHWRIVAPLVTGTIKPWQSEPAKPQARQLGLFGEVRS